MKTIVALLIVGVVSAAGPVSAKTPPKRPAKAAKARPTSIDKRSSDLRRAWRDKTRTQFTVLIKFTHPMAPDQIKPVVRWMTDDAAVGDLTRAEIQELVARDDVISVDLLPPPDPNAPE